MSKYIDDCLAAIAEARAALEELRLQWSDETGSVAIDNGIEAISDIAIMLRQRDEELFRVLNDAAAAVPTDDIDNYLRAAYARAEENR